MTLHHHSFIDSNSFLSFTHTHTPNIVYRVIMWKAELLQGIMLKVTSFTVVYALSIVAQSTSIPISNQFCPVPTTNSEFGNKVLDLHEIKGHKVRLQFFYPSEEASKKLLESSSVETTTWSPFSNGSTVATNSGLVETKSGEVEAETTTSTEKPQDLSGVDVYCQWTFKAANESQFLSLTFEKLSAPYSDNCEQAFVALQKEDGYESRWCGNRRQANARPMSLLARSSAVVTVYRSGNAPLLPVTGFKVSVRQLDFGSLQGAENSLRVLLG